MTRKSVRVPPSGGRFSGSVGRLPHLVRKIALALSLLGLLAAALSCRGASVSLLWDPSPDTNAVGYAVYYGAVGTLGPNRIDVGDVTNAPVNSLQPGFTYFFYVTAYDSARNESDPSNVINYTVPISVVPTVLVFSSDQVNGPWWQKFSSPLGTNVPRLDIIDLLPPWSGEAVAFLDASGQRWWQERVTNRVDKYWRAEVRP
jgi:hypothetical protein